jgi:hypothetical protein
VGGGGRLRQRINSRAPIAALCQNRIVQKMNYSRSLSTIVLFTFTGSTFAQSPEITVQTPPSAPIVGPLLRPFHFERRVVSPARLSNTPRLESLVRGGNLYLSVPDVIALVLENNIDIAIQRYGPVLASEVLRRAAGGGLLRSVGTPVYPGPVSVKPGSVPVCLCEFRAQHDTAQQRHFKRCPLAAGRHAVLPVRLWTIVSHGNHWTDLLR